MDQLEKFKNAKYVFVVGIGGSDLASKAVWNAVTLHKPDIKKKLFFLESPDLREYEEIDHIVQSEIFSAEQIALIAISKSGETAETLETFHKISDILSKRFGEQALSEKVLIISTKDTTLSKLAEQKNMTRLVWEGSVGGRFSAFTVPHTSVLYIAGLDTEAFASGGAEEKNACEKNSKDNRAVILAEDIFKNYKKGVSILDLFIFNSELEDLGKWCRQLVAESLGKENESGKKVGITPTVSIGPTDLHSMLQLDLGGPKNKFTLFIRSEKEIDGSINEKAYQNTIKAYANAHLPFSKYEMPEINEKEIGRFMAFMMAMTIELSNFLKVNPYDQPDVEEYKKHLTNNQ